MAEIVTNTGLANITAAWHGYASRARYLGWGTGNGQGVSDNALATAAPESRTEGTTSQQETTVSDDTYRVTGTITATGSRAITEVGVFDASTDGNMGIYGDFTVINLSTDDSIAFTVDVVLADGS